MLSVLFLDPALAHTAGEIGPRLFPSPPEQTDRQRAVTGDEQAERERLDRCRRQAERLERGHKAGEQRACDERSADKVQDPRRARCWLSRLA